MKHEQDFSEIFHALKKVLGEYDPPSVAKIDQDSRYELWSTKEVVIVGRKRKEVYFAGLTIRRDYVGFYYMPVYTDAEKIKRVFKPELLSTVKGKSCFYIRKVDDTLLAQINEALSIGFELYKKNGWV